MEQSRAITFSVLDVMPLLMQPTFTFDYVVASALAHVELVVSSNSELLFSSMWVNQFSHILYFDNHLKKPTIRLDTFPSLYICIVIFSSAFWLLGMGEFDTCVPCLYPTY